MKKKLSLGIIFIAITQIIPLLWNISLIPHIKNIAVIFASLAIWLTQPPVSTKETVENRKRDSFSVLLIIIISIVSVSSSIVDWAYFEADKLRFDYLTILGIALIVIGIAFRAWSINTLGDYFTATVQIKEKHQLITKGPYSIVRHPSYLGAWMAITGTSLFLNSFIGIAISFIGMLCAYIVRIRIEEQALTETFGRAYTDYGKSVKKLIPLIW